MDIAAVTGANTMEICYTKRYWCIRFETVYVYSIPGLFGLNTLVYAVQIFVVHSFVHWNDSKLPNSTAIELNILKCTACRRVHNSNHESSKENRRQASIKNPNTSLCKRNSVQPTVLACHNKVARHHCSENVYRIKPFTLITMINTLVHSWGGFRNNQKSASAPRPPNCRGRMNGAHGCNALVLNTWSDCTMQNVSNVGFVYGDIVFRRHLRFVQMFRENQILYRCWINEPSSICRDADRRRADESRNLVTIYF